MILILYYALCVKKIPLGTIKVLSSIHSNCKIYILKKITNWKDGTVLT